MKNNIDQFCQGYINFESHLSMLCNIHVYRSRVVWGGVLPSIGCIGMYDPKGYGFSIVVVINSQTWHLYLRIARFLEGPNYIQRQLEIHVWGNYKELQKQLEHFLLVMTLWRVNIAVCFFLLNGNLQDVCMRGYSCFFGDNFWWN